jgi:biopolymer transport protein ExbB
MTLAQFFWQGDGLARTVALLLLAMSVGSWVVIVWKTWLLHRASVDVKRCIAAFWQSKTVAEATQLIQAFDRESLVLPMVQAIEVQADGSLACAGERKQQLTRVLREALHVILGKLQHGQVLLATVGATAPFVGLLGTVWGIYHALIGIANAGQITIDKISGPVGESLIMTAAGLMVAIPAVLAYNILNRAVSRIEAKLEGFAHDLLGLDESRVTAP